MNKPTNQISMEDLRKLITIECDMITQKELDHIMLYIESYATKRFLASLPEKRASIYTHGALSIDDSENVDKQKDYNLGFNDCLIFIWSRLKSPKKGWEK